MPLSRLFSEFFNSEKAGGIILIVCTVLSMILANSGFSQDYTSFWQLQAFGHSITHWINDGLMSIFFLLIGLELEREIYKGELSELKNALLPIVAAIGGVLVPAGIYLVLNYGTPTQSGAGIPMATDIAFAIGVLALLGSKVPTSLKIFLTALAVIDDLCAILVIAIFYSSGISLLYLGIALAIFAFLCVLNRLKVNWLPIYLLAGVAMWYCMLQSGVHATISGVLLAFAIPFGDGNERSVSYRLQHFLHKPVAFFIVPLFALANTAIVFEAGWTNGLFSTESMGIIAGLGIGKPVGILLFSFLAVTAGICALPSDLRWKHLLGAGLLAGIGFTMSIFVTLLAFTDQHHISTAKIAIIAASLITAISGLVFLRIILKESVVKD
ncbi:Na+/H+ antiporter NhaA [Ferruginibacter sp. HRS2-29]|uniref:Na+/H+ antiporter NhaA n=1 Tax=Ferruginibacter sp. HRS2-29 TaxID=2487334 RepID=UPI0020CC8939|nr:Na+/H+ antiporter NhaA [Ferruginibacter sp. HRS2-29]MCP9753424.1 Na+/H+ antiporter NhaA [Ferruginibacter sp. HRS2-29]